MKICTKYSIIENIAYKKASNHLPTSCVTSYATNCRIIC